MLVSDLYCPSCRNAKGHKPQDNEICWSCVAMGGAGNYKESKTHGDQLRAMTDDELAEFLWDVWRHKRPFYKECVEGWLVPFYHWLKEEAKE